MKKHEIAKKMNPFHPGPNDTAGFYRKTGEGLKGREAKEMVASKASHVVKKPIMMTIKGRKVPYSEWVKMKK